MIKFSRFTYQLSYCNNINLAISRIKFSRLTKNPRNPQKLQPSKYSGYTVYVIHNMYIPYTTKHSMGKTFVVRTKMKIALDASYNNECLV